MRVWVSLLCLCESVSVRVCVVIVLPREPEADAHTPPIPCSCPYEPSPVVCHPVEYEWFCDTPERHATERLWTGLSIFFICVMFISLVCNIFSDSVNTFIIACQSGLILSLPSHTPFLSTIVLKEDTDSERLSWCAHPICCVYNTHNVHLTSIIMKSMVP
jgi:hypothetical protein